MRRQGEVVVIGIINYGLCNILSVKRAFYLYTDDVVIINSADDIKKADKLVLPGVGSFKDGMKALSNSSMSSAIHNAVSQGKLILGICLGMQMFFDGSYEGGKSYGFGFIKGWVEKIPVYSYFGEMQNVPHIGWNFYFLVKIEILKIQFLKMYLKTAKYTLYILLKEKQ